MALPSGKGNLRVVTYALIPNTQETVASISFDFKASLVYLGQPELHRETLSYKTEQNKGRKKA